MNNEYLVPEAVKAFAVRADRKNIFTNINEKHHATQVLIAIKEYCEIAMKKA